VNFGAGPPGTFLARRQETRSRGGRHAQTPAGLFEEIVYMKAGILMVLAFGLTMGVNAKDKDNDETLQGTWTLIAGEANGEPLSEEQLEGGKLVIDGNQYSVTLNDVGTVTGVQVVDTTLDPKTIDIVDASGPHEGQTCLGIYEVEGDLFRVAFASPGKPRPANFAAACESGSWIHVWQRVSE
jgi:uncharacterized protein (TIGR03067 family)